MNKLKYDIHVATEKVRMENGYLTRSERTKLQHMIDNSKEYIKDEPLKITVRPLVSNIEELRKPCSIVEPKEDVSHIIKELKETLPHYGGYALAANQIGYSKQVCYLKVPKQDPATKKMIFEEIVAINPIIIEKSRKIIAKDEGCLSFPGIRISTDRYVFSIIVYEDEKREKHTVLAQDLISLVWQHECDHLGGLVIMDKKHKGR